MSVVERSRKGTGIDYWLGDDVEQPYFQSKARLEVSGIGSGNAATIRRRVKEKRDQTRPSDGTHQPAHIVVVEFSGPIAHVETR